MIDGHEHQTVHHLQADDLLMQPQRWVWYDSAIENRHDPALEPTRPGWYTTLAQGEIRADMWADGMWITYSSGMVARSANPFSINSEALEWGIRNKPDADVAQG